MSRKKRSKKHKSHNKLVSSEFSEPVWSGPPGPEQEEFERRQFEEQVYWEEYAERNAPELPGKKHGAKALPSKSIPAEPDITPIDYPSESFLNERFIIPDHDGDVPF